MSARLALGISGAARNPTPRASGAQGSSQRPEGLCPALVSAKPQAAAPRLPASQTQPAPAKRAGPRPPSSCKPAVEASTPPRVQGDRPRRGFEPRPAGAESAYPEGAPSARTTEPSIHQPKGAKMEKPAPDLICQPRKSFPVNELQLETLPGNGKPRKPMILRSYTLCEVLKKSRKELPAAVGTRATC